MLQYLADHELNLHGASKRRLNLVVIASALNDSTYRFEREQIVVQRATLLRHEKDHSIALA